MMINVKGARKENTSRNGKPMYLKLLRYLELLSTALHISTMASM